MDVVPETLERPVWPLRLSFGAKFLQLSAGSGIAFIVIQTMVLLAGGEGATPPIALFLLFVSAALQAAAVGIMLERRAEIAVVAVMIGVSLALLTIAFGGRSEIIFTPEVLQVAILPSLFLVINRRWLPVSTNIHSIEPTLAIHPGASGPETSSGLPFPC